MTMATKVAVERVPLIKVDTALNSLRSSGYSLEAAVGEPIDNALEARANQIRLRLIEETQTVQRGKKEETLNIVGKIGIADDGCGMPAEVLERCLVLGESTRYDSRSGMGRFGVGGTLGAISQCKRIEVYSRSKSTGPYLYAYIDLDEIATKQQEYMFPPEERALPEEFADLLNAKGSGSLVVWSKCDKLSVTPSANARKAAKAKDVRSVDRVKTDLIKWIARTYRYFLANGRLIEVNGTKVGSFDPLYLLDSRYPDDPKGTLEFNHEIEWPIASNPETAAPIRIRMTLLPEAWRPEQGSGRETTFNRERRVVENEPLSIVRAEREIFFDIIPRFYPDGVREIARWIGIEISFDPRLDEAFQVRNVKRGVEPIEELRHELRKIIQPAMSTLVERVRKLWRTTENANKKKRGVHNAAEEIAAGAEQTSIKSRAGRDVTPEERDAKLDHLAEKSAEASARSNGNGNEPDPVETKRTADELRLRLKAMPFSIIDDQWPGNEFFSTEHLGENTIVTYNNKHPFFAKIYSKVLAASGALPESEGGSTITAENLAAMARVVQTGLDLMIVAYAKAEAMDDDAQNHELYSVLRTQWGLFLGQMVQRLPDAEL
jgi:hypothetical protein